MLFDKPSKKITGRIKFSGITPLGHNVSGYFFRIRQRTLQIKVGDEWHKVNKIFLSRIEGEENA